MSMQLHDLSKSFIPPHVQGQVKAPRCSACQALLVASQSLGRIDGIGLRVKSCSPLKAIVWWVQA